MALPLINREVALSVLAKFRGGSVAEGLEELRDRIREENPDYVAAVEVWASAMEEPNAQLFAIWTGIMGYALLESQSEADGLSRELEGRV